MVFIPRFPKKALQIVFYMLFWVALAVGIEWMSYLLGSFKYDNGWNIWYTAVFDFFMYSMLLFFYKKPLFAILVSFALAFLMLIIFRVPLQNML